MTDEANGGKVASTATVTTPKAEGYAAQLCKHFGHKIPATFEDGRGEVVFEMGTCTLDAEGDRLTMRVEAGDGEAVGRLEKVMADHLLRFAFREELTVNWQRA